MTSMSDLIRHLILNAHKKPTGTQIQKRIQTKSTMTSAAQPRAPTIQEMNQAAVACLEQGQDAMAWVHFQAGMRRLQGVVTQTPHLDWLNPHRQQGQDQPSSMIKVLYKADFETGTGTSIQDKATAGVFVNNPFDIYDGFMGPVASTEDASGLTEVLMLFYNAGLYWHLQGLKKAKHSHLKKAWHFYRLAGKILFHWTLEACLQHQQLALALWSNQGQLAWHFGNFACAHNLASHMVDLLSVLMNDWARNSHAAGAAADENDVVSATLAHHQFFYFNAYHCQMSGGSPKLAPMA